MKVSAFNSPSGIKWGSGRRTDKSDRRLLTDGVPKNYQNTGTNATKKKISKSWKFYCQEEEEKNEARRDADAARLSNAPAVRQLGGGRAVQRNSTSLSFWVCCVCNTCRTSHPGLSATCWASGGGWEEEARHSRTKALGRPVGERKRQKPRHGIGPKKKRKREKILLVDLIDFFFLFIPSRNYSPRPDWSSPFR